VKRESEDSSTLWMKHGYIQDQKRRGLARWTAGLRVRRHGKRHQSL